jgi:hypothetical protein
MKYKTSDILVDLIGKIALYASAWHFGRWWGISAAIGLLLAIKHGPKKE